MDLFKVIAEMNGEGQNFVIPRLYVKLAGGHVEALVLKQLVFWSNKTTRTDGYFYKKSEELQRETEMTRRQIDRVVKKLVDSGLIETQLKKANGAPTRHFKIKQDEIVSRLHQMVQSNAPNGAIRMHETVQSLTDSNTDSNNRRNNNNVQSPKDDLNERFETVYKLYPKKQGKKRALAAYKKAVKAGVTDETIIDGIKRYCFMLETTRTNVKYIKQAGTWFFNEGWNDEYATDGRFRANAGTNQAGATESGGIVERIAKQRAENGKPLDKSWESELDDLEWFD